MHDAGVLRLMHDISPSIHDVGFSTHVVLISTHRGVGAAIHDVVVTVHDAESHPTVGLAASVPELFT